MRARQLAGTRHGAAALALLSVSAVLALAAGVAPANAADPVRVNTGGVSHLRGTTAQLNGVVITTVPANVFFKYGPTVAYGSQTKPLAISPPSPPKAIKVGQPVTGLLPNYHYRMFATYVENGVVKTVEGKDKSFTGGKASQLKFVMAKGKEARISVVYGSTLDLSGSLSGKASAFHGLSLQATPFPYTEPFTTLGGSISSRTGSFLFKVTRMTQNTQFRILTIDPRPVYSPTVNVHVTPRFTLHVRSAGHSGLYRLYGTVSPSHPGAFLTIQQLVPQKAASKRSGPATHAVGNTALKRATKTTSRFSVVVRLSGTFRYRAFVRLPKGAVDSGHSSNVLIKAPAAKPGHHNRKHK